MPSPAPFEPAAADPPLVGREAELRRVLAAVDRAGSGRGGTVLLAGDAGIGKTRLATEALAAAARRGFLVLRGAAYPFGGDLAYAPFLEAIGPHLGSLPADRLSVLAAGLPDLARLFPDLAPGEPASGFDPPLERTRLLEAVARLVERMAAGAPVVLLLDDLHWADTASLDLFAYLARGLSGQAVLLLGAYRADEAREHPQLPTMVRSLRRQGVADQLDLPALTGTEVAALVRELLGAAPPADMLTALDRRAGGSPLFVTALVGSLVQAGALRRVGRGWVVAPDGLAAVPPVLRELVLARLEHLDDDARQWLEWVAVAGDAATLELLSAATGREPDRVAERVRSLLAAGLLVEEPVDGDVGYRTGHPLVAEVTYAEMPEALRRSRHAVLAAALAERHPDDVDRLAHHYRGAGGAVDPVRALDVLALAGERALAMHAAATATTHLDAAVQIATRIRPERVPELLERLGDAHSGAGHGEAAAEVRRRAADAYAGAGNRRAVARLRRQLAVAEWDAGRFDAAEAEIAAGLAALGDRTDATDPTGEPADTAELLELRILRVQHLGRRGDLDAMTRETADLLRVAERSGAERAVVALHMAASDEAMLRGRMADLRHHAQHAVAAAYRAGLPLHAAVAHRKLAILALSSGHLDEAEPHLAADRAAAEGSGVPALSVSPLLMQLVRAMATDDWAAGLRAADSLIALGHRTEVPRALAGAYAFQAMVLGFQGRLDDADERLAEAAAAFGRGQATDRHLYATAEVVGAWVALAKDEPERALRLAAAASRLNRQLPGLTLAARGKAEILLDDTAAARATARELEAFGAPWPDAVAARLHGNVAVAEGDPGGALPWFAAAVAGFDRLGMPFKAAGARLNWAEAAIATGATGGMAEEIRRALVAYEVREARPYADRARRLLRRLGERPAAPVRGAPTRDLTDRELEVVRLVADGLSNAEVAGRLFISPRTVTTHLQHVYARLGISSRAGLVRWSVERGLVTDVRTPTASDTGPDT